MFLIKYILILPLYFIIEHTKEVKPADALDTKQLYVEVLVGIDESVRKFHGSSVIEQYVLTQMSIVNDIYQHESLGINVNVIVSKILFIDSKNEKIIVSNDARMTLENFCNWANQKRIHTKNISAINFDIALFLTREGFGPAGYASVTGMCVKERGCAIVKDDGASSAFVIAHEIGHIFGMIHDGHGNNCSSDASDGRIMAAMVQSNYNLYHWSQCSKETIKKHFKDYHCLLNKPENQLIPKYSQPFGQSWSLDEQCRQEFGADYNLCKAFDGTDPCKLLWCGHGANSTICKTKRGPPLPGTSCDRGKWCIENECRNRSSVSIDGNWSNWSSWTSCSKSCQYGVQSRSRICSNPRPSFGGKSCEGEDNENKICNIQPCIEKKDSRLEQCTVFNKRRFDNNKQHQWIPAENNHKNDICKLTCISKEFGIQFTTDEYVIDGTLCNYESENKICINGICVEVGCDGDFDSKKKNDLCGICGGDSTDCVKIKNNIHSLLTKKEYTILVKIPAEARSITIRENSSRPHLAHFLAIRDIETEEWILNGGEIQSSTSSFISHGTLFKYESSERGGETITASGPLNAPIEILIYSQSSKITTNVDYEFFIHKDYNISISEDNGTSTTLPYTSRYEWAPNGWSECSKTCDTGFQTELMICIDVKKQRIVRGLCNQNQNQNATRRECNIRPCSTTTVIIQTTKKLRPKNESPYWWQAKDWSACSISCGNGGFQGREVSCVTKDASGQIVAIQPAYCNSRTIPEYIKTCDYVAC